MRDPDRKNLFMTSRLFHTVVAVGLSLGAMTAGCAAEPAQETGTDTAEVSTYTPATEPVTTPTVTPDRFCEVPWPTTKGGNKPAESQACIDPQNECGEYPGLRFGRYSDETCVRAAEVTACDFEQGEIWMFCKDTGTTKEWKCPAGTVPVNSCVWPENGEPAKEARL